MFQNLNQEITKCNIDTFKKELLEYADDPNYLELKLKNPNCPLHSNFPFDEIIKGEMAGPILQILDDLYFILPSKIQCDSIRVLNDENNKNDLIAQSGSGTGKTIAMITSILLHIELGIKKVQSIFISPTKELSNQHYELFHEMNQYTKFDGFLSDKEEDDGNGKINEKQIIFGTPNSVHNLIEKNKIDTTNVKFVIIDESDIIFDESGPYLTIIKEMMNNRLSTDVQYGFFSSTFKQSTIQYLKSLRPNIKTILPSPKDKYYNETTHLYTRSNDFEETKKMIKEIVSANPDYQSIVFCDDEVTCKTIARYLNDNNVSSQAYLMKEGNDEQRRQILQKYHRAEYQVITSTEILSIGIDNYYIQIVINVGLPNKKTMEDEVIQYYRRSGRCGRFGRRGFCLSIIQTDDEEEKIKEYQQFMQPSNQNDPCEDQDQNASCEDQDQNAPCQDQSDHWEDPWENKNPNGPFINLK